MVKHFYWEPRGKVRIHKKPTAWHVRACRPRLTAELAAVQPRALICLGATAPQTLLGRNICITQIRGQLIPSPLARYVVATLHPSAVLRAPDDASRQAAMAHLVGDLAAVARLLRKKRSEQDTDTDEVELGNLVGSLMRQLKSVLDGGLLQENVQIVIHPIFTWPDGRLSMWVIVNWPN